MKTASVRDLRNRFPRVAAWIADGEAVEITKAGKVFARLIPPVQFKKTKLVKPDIMAQLRETWGDRVFSAQEVAEMRARNWMARKDDRLPGHVLLVRPLCATGQFPCGGGLVQSHA